MSNGRGKRNRYWTELGIFQRQALMKRLAEYEGRDGFLLWLQCACGEGTMPSDEDGSKLVVMFAKMDGKKLPPLNKYGRPMKGQRNKTSSMTKHRAKVAESRERAQVALATGVPEVMPATRKKRNNKVIVTYMH